jgi:hypothetical protein
MSLIFAGEEGEAVGFRPARESAEVPPTPMATVPKFYSKYRPD